MCIQNWTWTDAAVGSFKWKCFFPMNYIGQVQTWRISYVPNLMQIKKHLLFVLFKIRFGACAMRRLNCALQVYVDVNIRVKLIGYRLRGYKPAISCRPPGVLPILGVYDWKRYSWSVSDIMRRAERFHLFKHKSVRKVGIFGFNRSFSKCVSSIGRNDWSVF